MVVNIALREELLDVVDDANIVIGSATRKEIYENGWNLRIAHVFVVHPDTKELYLQRRADHVRYKPGHLSTSAAGHVVCGESPLEAAQRELYEEIGLKTELELINEFKIESAHPESSTCFVSLYIAYARDGFTFIDGEVAEGRFMGQQAIQDLLEQDSTVHPHVRPCFVAYLEYCKEGS